MTTDTSSTEMTLSAPPAVPLHSSESTLSMAKGLPAQPQTEEKESKNVATKKRNHLKRPTPAVPVHVRRGILGRRRMSHRPLPRHRPSRPNMARVLERTAFLEKENSALRGRLEKELEQKRLMIENSLMRFLLRNICQNIHVAALLKNKKLL